MTTVINMNQISQIRNIVETYELRFEYQEVIDFVNSKLRSFKRIDYDILRELLIKRFNCANAENLLQALIEEKLVKFQNDHLVAYNYLPLLNEENLKILAA